MMVRIAAKKLKISLAVMLKMIYRKTNQKCQYEIIIFLIIWVPGIRPRMVITRLNMCGSYQWNSQHHYDKLFLPRPGSLGKWSYNSLAVTSQLWTYPNHIGALQCADCFHSQNWHTVLSRSDSRDPGNLGMLAGVVVWLISASDMAAGVVADAGQNFSQHRPVILLQLWPTQARIFANTGQWYCWSCGQRRSLFF